MAFDKSWLDSNQFDWKAALALIMASDLAYGGRQTVELTAKLFWKVDSVAFFEAGNAEGFVAEDAANMMIAFRGSSEADDWAKNLDGAWVPAPEFHGRAHKGFLDTYAFVEQDIAAAVARLNGRRLWLTGHSLGGALGLIAMARYHAQVPGARLVTFGQPAMLNYTAAQWVAQEIGARYVRVVNHIDIVSRLPPGHFHTGWKRHFDADGNLRGGASPIAAADMPEENPPADTDAETHGKLAGAARTRGARFDPSSALGWIPGVPEHATSAYITCIRALAGV